MNEQHTKEHTPEPWEVIENDGAYVKDNSMAKFRIETSLESGRDLCVALVVTDCPDLDNKANARRIVACVNATAGLSTEMLENATANGGIFQSIRIERDTLRARVAVLETALAAVDSKLNRDNPYAPVGREVKPTWFDIKDMVHAALQNNGVSHE